MGDFPDGLKKKRSLSIWYRKAPPAVPTGLKDAVGTEKGGLRYKPAKGTSILSVSRFAETCGDSGFFYLM